MAVKLSHRPLFFCFLAISFSYDPGYERIRADESAAAGCFPGHHRHSASRSRPLLRLPEYRDAGTRRSGERWNSLHSGLHSQPDHQHIAHQHSYRTASQFAWGYGFCCAFVLNSSDLGGTFAQAGLPHGGIYRRGDSRQQELWLRVWIEGLIFTITSPSTRNRSRAGAGLNGAAWMSSSVQKLGSARIRRGHILFGCICMIPTIPMSRPRLIREFTKIICMTVKSPTPIQRSQTSSHI